jgi:hypothetical protein
MPVFVTGGTGYIEGRIEISDEGGKVLLSVPFTDAATVKGL